MVSTIGHSITLSFFEQKTSNSCSPRKSRSDREEANQKQADATNGKQAFFAHIWNFSITHYHFLNRKPVNFVVRERAEVIEKQVFDVTNVKQANFSHYKSIVVISIDYSITL